MYTNTLVPVSWRTELPALAIRRAFVVFSDTMPRKAQRTRLLLSMILWTVLSQLMVSAYACTLMPEAMGGAGAAFAQSPAAACTGMEKSSVPGDLPTPLCHAHCVQPPQTSQTAVPDLPTLSLVALFEIPRHAADHLVSQRLDAPYLIPPSSDGGPPLRIQYQVSRI